MAGIEVCGGIGKIRMGKRLDTVEPVLLHNIRQDTFHAVRQVDAVQPEMTKRADIEIDT